MTLNIFYFLICAAAAILTVTRIKSGRFITGVIFTAAEGICALFAVNLLTGFTGVHISTAPLCLGISAVGGIPGVVLMLALNIFTKQ